MAPFNLKSEAPRFNDEGVVQDSESISSSSIGIEEEESTTLSKFHTSDDNNSDGDDDSHKEIQAQLTKKETQAVFRIRVIVILVLVVVAAAVSAIVNLITKGGETEEFKSQWEGSSQKVLDGKFVRSFSRSVVSIEKQ